MNNMDQERIDLLTAIATVIAEYEDVAEHAVDCEITFGDDPHELYYYSPEEEKPFSSRREK